METGGNCYVMSCRRHVRTFPFITPSVTVDALGQGQGVEKTLSTLDSHTSLGEGRAGQGASLSLVEPVPLGPHSHRWVCSLGPTPGVPAAWAGHHGTSSSGPGPWAPPASLRGCAGLSQQHRAEGRGRDREGGSSWTSHFLRGAQHVSGGRTATQWGWPSPRDVLHGDRVSLKRVFSFPLPGRTSSLLLLTAC